MPKGVFFVVEIFRGFTHDTFGEHHRHFFFKIQQAQKGGGVSIHKYMSVALHALIHISIFFSFCDFI